MSAYPHTLGDLHQYLPQDGDEISADAFNALHVEVMTIEAVLGLDVGGAAASLEARLAVAMNGDGSWKAELSCEDGTEGVGSRRYWSTTALTDNVNTLTYSYSNLPAALFDEDPIFIAGSWSDRSSAPQHSAQGVFVVESISPSGVRCFRNRQLIGNSGSYYMTGIAISQLQTFQDDTPYAAPPWRSGAVVMHPLTG